MVTQKQVARFAAIRSSKARAAAAAAKPKRTQAQVARSIAIRNAKATRAARAA